MKTDGVGLIYGVVLQTGFICTIRVRNTSCRNRDGQFAGSIRNDVHLNEQNSDFPRNPCMSGKWNRPRNEIRDHSPRIGQKSIRHYGQGQVHGQSLPGPDLACGDRGLPDFLPAVLEEGGAVFEFEPDFVRVFYGDGGIEGDVESDVHAKSVECDVGVSECDGVDGGDGAASLEDCGAEDGEEEGEADEYGGKNQAAATPAAALVIGVHAPKWAGMWACSGIRV